METNVEAKTVVVQADESVSPHSMLEKLQKVGGEPSTTVLLWCLTDGRILDPWSHVVVSLHLVYLCVSDSKWSASSGKSVELAA